ncbi:ABC transporter ATP-binding protein, partial [Streptomyces sp. NPDC002690]
MPDRTEAENAPSPGAADPSGRPPAVRVRGLWKRFGQQMAVSGIDLDLPAG